MTTDRRGFLLFGLLFAALAILCAAIALGAQVLTTQVSPDGQWRVEIADYAKPTQLELWSTPAIGGTRRKIGGPVKADYDVSEFVIAADSRQVAYRYGRTATGEWALYSTRIDAPPGVRISPPTGRVEPGITLASNGTAIRYRWSAIPGAEPSAYVVGVAGGRILREVFVDGFESGRVEMSIDDHVSPHEMFLLAAAILLLAIRLLGLMDLSWWATTLPVWGYLVLIGLAARLQEYIS